MFKLINFLQDPTFSEGFVNFAKVFGDGYPMILAMVKVVSIFLGSLLTLLTILVLGFLVYRVYKTIKRIALR